MKNISVIYGIPIYGAGEEQRIAEAPFFKLNLNEESLVNAYRYLAYRFGQYLLLETGAVVKEYDPLAGRLVVEGNLTPDDVLNKYRDFVEKYLVPKLKTPLAHASINEVLPAFYYRKRESKPTGLSTVVLSARHVQQYFDALLSGDYAIQRTKSVKGSIEKARGKVLENLKTFGLRHDDIVIIDKTGGVEVLTDDKMIAAFQCIPGADAIGVKKVGRSCIYCDASNIPLYPATGKLGVGRTRLPHETTTDLSGKAKICLRCLLVAVLYRLDTGGDFFIQLSGSSMRFRDEKVRAEGETLRAIQTVLQKLKHHPCSGALIFNSLFGVDRATLRIEGLDEEVFEKLALLYATLGTTSFSDEVESLLVSYVNAPSFSDSLRTLLHILKKQSEKAGVPNMSYVSKYITSKLYAQRKDKRVAYALAKLAEAVVYRIDQSNVENKDYVKRRFADILRRAGLSKAIEYAMSATNTPIEVLTVLVKSGEERDHIKRVIDEYKIKYREEGDVLKVYVDNIPLAEIMIVEEFSQGIYEDVYTYLAILKPSVEIGEVKEEVTKVSGGA